MDEIACAKSLNRPQLRNFNNIKRKPSSRSLLGKGGERLEFPSKRVDHLELVGQDNEFRFCPNFEKKTLEFLEQRNDMILSSLWKLRC